MRDRIWGLVLEGIRYFDVSFFVWERGKLGQVSLRDLHKSIDDTEGNHEAAEPDVDGG